MKYPKYLEKGMQFGRLTVVEVDKNSKVKDGNYTKPSIWKYFCTCSCTENHIISVVRGSLVKGTTTSCGCYVKERNSKHFSKTNPIEDCGDYIKIFFFNKDHGFTIIDKEDYGKVKDFCWYRHQPSTGGLFYASANSKGHFDTEVITMHSIILPCESPLIPDHINGDGLHNIKSNLRLATRSQNSMNTRLRSDNTSGQTGIAWIKLNQKWWAYIEINYKRRNLGYFSNKEDAIKARKEAEEKYFGEFSYDNSRIGGVCDFNHTRKV